MNRRQLLGRFAVGAAAVSTASVVVPEATKASQLMPMMVSGQIYCEHCDADWFPRFGWQGPNHIAVRLWDDHGEDGRDLQALQMPTKAYFFGEQLLWVTEAYAGDDGWILRELSTVNERGHQDSLYCSRCRLGRTFQLRTGRVSFEQPKRDQYIADPYFGEAWVQRLEADIRRRLG